MKEFSKESNIVTVLSVVGFIFGVLVMLASFIPFIGSLAFFFGIPAAILSIVVIMQNLPVVKFSEKLCGMINKR